MRRQIGPLCGDSMASCELRCESLDRIRHEAMLIDFAGVLREEGEDRYDALLFDPDAFFESARRFEDAVDLPPDRVPGGRLRAGDDVAA